MPKNPELELEEFLVSVPAWMRRTFETGFPSLSQAEIAQWFGNYDELSRLQREYERILQLIPVKWREYRKRLKREAHQSFQFESKFLIPKEKLGRPLDSKAQKYFELHSSGVSCREIAKRELQAGPDGTYEELRLDSASESIRQAIIRYRRRIKT